MKNGSDNCSTSVAGFYRSCPNPCCSYDLCLACCQELRNGCQPGGIEAGTLNEQFVEKDGNQDSTRTCSKTHTDRHGWESQLLPNVSDIQTDGTCPFPEWRANSDGNIPCPPKQHGGCGTALLELRRSFKADWVVTLLKNAEDLTRDYRPLDFDVSVKCSLCWPNLVDGKFYYEVRQAASRDDGQDNFLYCSNALHMSDDEVEHFQRHWIRGKPVIVRNVLDMTSGLSWDPMVIICALSSWLCLLYVRYPLGITATYRFPCDNSRLCLLYVRYLHGFLTLTDYVGACDLGFNKLFFHTGRLPAHVLDSLQC